MAEMELRPFDEQITRRSGASFFWWSVLLLLLTGACFASWLGSFYVISHPEVPKCYKLLKRLKRVEAPKRFAVTDAPKGEFLAPAKLLERFGKMGPAELERENSDLLRAFIMNYREAKRHTIYVTGKFDVVEAYPLGPKDFFPTGVAVIAQAIEFPQLVLEQLFTAPAKTVPAIKAAFPIGIDVTLHRSRDLFALLHVERLADGRMQFTAIPLPYGGWRSKARELEFTLRSPEELEKADPKFTMNIDAGLPVVRGERLAKGLTAYASFRQKSLASTTDDQRALASPELERFEVRVPAVAEAGAGTIVEPIPAAPPKPLPTVAPGGKSPAPAGPTPRPQPTPAPSVPLAPRPIVKNTPRPTPAPVVPAPLIGATPAIAPPPATPTPALPVANARSTPAPKAAERRILTPAQASALVDQFKPAEPAVLTGDFVVTGVLGQRVALRTRESLRDPGADPTQPGTTAALIVVDFPPGVPPPAKDSAFSRDGERGFQVRDVIRGRNGQITIVAAEPGR
jgi:hypothetical protein